jgi:hypothetical protein
VAGRCTPTGGPHKDKPEDLEPLFNGGRNRALGGRTRCVIDSDLHRIEAHVASVTGGSTADTLHVIEAGLRRPSLRLSSSYQFTIGGIRRVADQAWGGICVDDRYRRA